MKIGIIISQTNPETVWNALRFANFTLKQNDEAKQKFWRAVHA